MPHFTLSLHTGLVAQDGKDSTQNEGNPGSIPGSGRSLGKGSGNPLTPVFLPGESHGQRSLASYSSRGYKRVRHDLGTKKRVLLSLFFLKELTVQ